MRSMMDDTTRSRSLYAIAGGRSLESAQEFASAATLPSVTALWFMVSGFFVSAAIVSSFLFTGHGLLSVASVLALSAAAIASFVTGSIAWPGEDSGIQTLSSDDNGEYTDWDNVRAVLNTAGWLMLSGSLLTLTVFFTAFQWQLGYNLVALSVATGVGSLVANIIGFGIFDASTEAAAEQTYTMLPFPRATGDEFTPTALARTQLEKAYAEPKPSDEPLNVPGDEAPAVEPEVEFENLKSVSIVDEASAADLLDLLVNLESFALDASPAIRADELLERLENLSIEGFPALESEPVQVVDEPRPVSRIPVKVEF